MVGQQATIRLADVIVSCALTSAATAQTVGAPLRTVTVRDTIGDLPPIENGGGPRGDALRR